MTTSPVPQGDDFRDLPIRPVQYRDLEDIEALTLDDFDEDIDPHPGATGASLVWVV
jgi:hypothetical protein